MADPGDGVDAVGLRLDKWLWHCRFFKTRALSTAAVRGGHVRLNGDRVKPGARVRAGDRLHIVKQQLEYDITVRRLPSRRGPARETRRCYEEADESRLKRERFSEQLRMDRRQLPVTDGRPDKRTRRALRSRKLGSGS